MYNREFVFMGIDLRIPSIVLGGILLFNPMIEVLINKKLTLLVKDKYFLIINIFFILILLNNVMWLYNGLELNLPPFFVILFSTIYNYLFVLVIYFNFNLVKKDMIIKYMNISFIFLFMSMLLTLVGIDLPKLIGQDFRYYSPPGDFTVLNIRIAGFAEDPNYASFLSIMTLLSNLIFNVRKKLFFMLVVILVIAALFLTFSVTILIISSLSLVIYVLEKKIIKKSITNTFSLIASAGLIFTPFLSFILNIVEIGINTMDQRFIMWNSAINLFLRSPILGSGLTSFRSYFDLFPYGRYVQPHNTFLSILSESGIIVFCLLIFILLYQFKLKKELHSLMLLLLVSLCFTYEITNHPYIVYISSLMYFQLRSNYSYLNSYADQKLKSS